MMRLADRGLRIALLGVTAFALVQLARFGLLDRYSTDEFTYAHAAWAIAHGQQPFRDFFLHHFPLSMQLGSLVFVLDDHPTAIRHLRALMMPVWLATAGLAVALNRRSSWAALLTVPILAAFAKWADYATEFRPDALAIALFLASLVLATQRGAHDRLCGWLAGLAWVAAVWASQKVLIYGWVVPVAGAVDTIAGRTPRPARLLGAPRQFAAGALAGAAAVAAYLTVTGNWQPWYRWCFEWGLVHETVYPERAAIRSLGGTLHQTGHLLALALLGALLTLRRCVGQSERPWHADPELLTVAALLTTSISYFVQNAPYGWSLIAPLTFAAIFAARAVAALIDGAARLRVGPQLALGLKLLVVLAAVWPTFRIGEALTRPDRRNAPQLATLARIARMSSDADPIYDNTGMYVARPHVHFFFFTDKAARIELERTLVRDMPRAILERGATLSLRDKRFRELPHELRRFLEDHFVDVSDGIMLWGKTFVGLPRGTSQSFLAVRGSQYYVTPADVAQSGKLRIDAALLRGQRIALAKGEHRVEWLGDTPAPKLAILWLPRDGSMPAPER